MSTRALYEDAEFEGVGRRSTRRWKDLGLDVLLPPDPVTEEEAKAKAARNSVHTSSRRVERESNPFKSMDGAVRLCMQKLTHALPFQRYLNQREKMATELEMKKRKAQMGKTTMGKRRKRWNELLHLRHPAGVSTHPFDADVQFLWKGVTCSIASLLMRVLLFVSHEEHHLRKPHQRHAYGMSGIQKLANQTSSLFAPITSLSPPLPL